MLARAKRETIAIKQQEKGSCSAEDPRGSHTCRARHVTPTPAGRVMLLPHLQGASCYSHTCRARHATPTPAGRVMLLPHLQGASCYSHTCRVRHATPTPAGRVMLLSHLHRPANKQVLRHQEPVEKEANTVPSHAASPTVKHVFCLTKQLIAASTLGWMRQSSHTVAASTLGWMKQSRHAVTASTLGWMKQSRHTVAASTLG